MLLLWIIYVISVLFLLCFRACSFINALWSSAGNGLKSWLSFVMSNCEVVTFPLVSWVTCGARLYQFLIFGPFLTLLVKDSTEALCCVLEQDSILCIVQVQQNHPDMAEKLLTGKLTGLPLGGRTPYITSKNRLRTPKLHIKDVPRTSENSLVRPKMDIETSWQQKKNPPTFTRLRDLCPAFVLETHLFCLLTTLGRPT